MYTLLQAILLLSSSSCLAHPSTLTIPAIPLDDAADPSITPLPTPTSTLRYIAVQVGTQNYTCNADTGIYTAIGALARIYDATAFLMSVPREIDSLSQNYLATYVSQQYHREVTSDVALNNACENYTDSQYHPLLPVLGRHYFTSIGTPTFDLALAPEHPFLYAKKLSSVHAPSSQDVDWLYLVSNGST